MTDHYPESHVAWRRERTFIVGTPEDEFEWLPATPDDEPDPETAGDYLATIEHAIEALREQAFEPNQMSIGFDFGADGTPEITHVSIDPPREGDEIYVETDRCQTVGTVDEGIRLQNELLQEELRQVHVQCHENIANSWRTKETPIDRLYPHYCQNEKCGRRLWFSEMRAVNKNLNRKYLRKLWKNPHVQFLCCACYRKVTLTDVHQAPEYSGPAYIYAEREVLQNSEEYQGYINQLQDDICEGTGLSREELFGSIEHLEHELDQYPPMNVHFTPTDDHYGSSMNPDDDDDD